MYVCYMHARLQVQGNCYGPANAGQHGKKNNMKFGKSEKKRTQYKCQMNQWVCEIKFKWVRRESIHTHMHKRSQIQCMKRHTYVYVYCNAIFFYSLACVDFFGSIFFSQSHLFCSASAPLPATLAPIYSIRWRYTYTWFVSVLFHVRERKYIPIGFTLSVCVALKIVLLYIFIFFLPSACEIVLIFCIFFGSGFIYCSYSTFNANSSFFSHFFCFVCMFFLSKRHSYAN